MRIPLQGQREEGYKAVASVRSLGPRFIGKDFRWPDVCGLAEAAQVCIEINVVGIEATQRWISPDASAL